MSIRYRYRVRNPTTYTTRRRSGQKGDETAKPVEFCENLRVLQEPASSGCDIDRVLRDRSSLVSENSAVGCAAK